MVIVGGEIHFTKHPWWKPHICSGFCWRLCQHFVVRVSVATELYLYLLMLYFSFIRSDATICG